MTALAIGRKTDQLVMQDDGFLELPVAAAKHVYAGSLVMIKGGLAFPGITTALAGWYAAGMADFDLDNSAGSTGSSDLLRIRRGVFGYNNSSAGDAISNSDIGNICYVVDDQTVAKTSNSSTRTAAGYVYEVDAVTGQVFVAIGMGSSTLTGSIGPTGPTGATGPTGP